RSRRFHRVLASVIIAAMLVGPLLQAREVNAFAGRLAERQAMWEAQQEAQKAEQNLDSELGRDAFDPLANPLAEAVASSQLAASSNGCAVQQAAPPTAITSTIDSDGDGLSDIIETEKLGTDPHNIDTDGDTISDKTEVEGYAVAGRQWYLNPLQPDSNGDG